MTSKFWLQTRSRGGNWVDSLGTQDKESAISHGRYLRDRNNDTTRVVTRKDTVIWDGGRDTTKYKENPRRRRNPRKSRFNVGRYKVQAFINGKWVDRISYSSPQFSNPEGLAFSAAKVLARIERVKVRVVR